MLMQLAWRGGVHGCIAACWSCAVGKARSETCGLENAWSKKARLDRAELRQGLDLRA